MPPATIPIAAHTVPQPIADADVLAAACAVVPGFPAALGSVAIAAITGGLTNAIYKISPLPGSGGADGGAPHPPVLVRVFGEGSDVLIDRGREDVTFKRLSDAGLGERRRPARCAPLSSLLTTSPQQARPSTAASPTAAWRGGSSGAGRWSRRT